MQQPTTKKVNGVWYDINEAAERIKELEFQRDKYENEVMNRAAASERLEAKLERLEGAHREQQARWDWLTKSVLVLSDEGYTKWASVVLALVNKCRYESLEEE